VLLRTGLSVHSATQTPGGTGLDVAGDGDLESHAAVGEMVQEPRILGAADAVADPPWG
jgi:hypothetical protein